MTHFEEEVQKIVHWIGDKLHDAATHLPTVVEVMGKFKELVDNDAVDAVAVLLLGKPQEELYKEALDRMLIFLTHGSIIGEDVANAKTWQDKLKIFGEDLKKYNVKVRHMKVGDLTALVIHDLSNGGMSINDATRAVEDIVNAYNIAA